MKLFKKTAMCVALSAALIGGLLATQTANADGNKKNKVGVNPNRLGQVLIFPYYSVRKSSEVEGTGFKSFFNITNTSGDTLALRARFHEGQNSRDVLDFTIVLSAFDVWTGWVEEQGIGADSVPRLFSNDNSCTPGATNLKPADGGQAFSNLSYSAPYADLGPDTIDRAREGYLEVVVMGKVPAFDFSSDNNSDWGVDNPISVAANAKHLNGVPVNCNAVNFAFAVGSGNTGSVPTPSLPVAYPFEDDFNNILGDGDPQAQVQFRALNKHDNPLKGNFSIIKEDEGIGAGNGAVAISNYMKLGMGSSRQDGNNLITAQGFPYSNEPTVASGKGIWTVDGLEGFEEAIGSKDVTNEWANNPDSGAHLDWAITFPTKAFHVDYTADDDNIYAANNQWRRYLDGGGEPGEPSKDELVGEVFEDNATAEGAAVSVYLTGYDREEAIVGNPFPSPDGGSLGPVLLGETNVITFADTDALNKSALSSKQFNLNYDIAAKIKASGTNDNAKNGWAKLGFLYSGLVFFPIEEDIFGTVSRTICEIVEEGVEVCETETTFEFIRTEEVGEGSKNVAAESNAFPVVGWAYKTRNQGNPELAYSQILPHSWDKSRDFGENED